MTRKNKVDWHKVRAEYPAVHKGVYLSTAAVGPINEMVYKAQISHAEMMYQNGDTDWYASVEKLHKTRELFAELFDAKSEDVFFGHSTSLNMNLVAQLVKSQRGIGNIISCEDEFPSTVIPWKYHGFDVKKVKTNNSYFDVKDLENLIDGETRVIALSRQQFATGFRCAVDGIKNLAQKYNLLFVLNATQSLGVEKFSFRESGADVVLASCHKWMNMGYGLSVGFFNEKIRSGNYPVVAGWLSVEEEDMMSHKLSVRKDAAAMECGVPAFQLMAGVYEQLKYIEKIGLENIQSRISELIRYFLKGLTKYPHIDVLSYIEDEAFLGGTVLLGIKESMEVVDKLHKKSVFVSDRSEAIRVSLSYYNNEEDISTFFHELNQALV